MKQRLLLALLVLFAAAGMVKAANEPTVKVKSNQSNEVTITFSEAVSTATKTGVTLSSDKKIVTIKPSAGSSDISISWADTPTGDNPSITVGGNINTLEINDSHVKSLSFSKGCHVDVLKVSCSSLTSLECSELGLTKLTLTGSTKLEKVDVSKNQLSKVGTINSSNPTTTTPADADLIDLSVCKDNLKTLNISNNAFVTFDPSTFTKVTDLDVSGNKLSEINVSALKSLGKLDISNNHIVDFKAGHAPAPTEGTTSVTYGTQDIKLSDGETGDYNEQPANTGYAIKKIIDKALASLDRKSYSFKSWKVKSGDEYVADSPQTAHAMPSPYSDEYRFYDKDGVYVDGTYQLSVTVDGREFNIYNVIVKPAKFKLTWDTPANAKDPATGKTNPVINVAGRDASSSTLTNGGEVYQGEVLTINTDPKDGYDRIVYTLVSGLVPTGTGEAIDKDHPNSYAQNPFTCKVEGKFKDRATSIEPKFTTEVSGTQHFVTFIPADKTKGGTFTVEKKHGSQTTPFAANTKNEIATGDQLIVKLLPNASYEGTLYINNDKIDQVDKNNVYTYPVKSTDKDFNISVTFEKKEVKLECRIDGIELKGTNLTTDLAYIKEQKITIDGGVDKGGTVIPKGTNGDEDVFVAKNTDHQFSFTINQTTGHEHCILDVINISGGELKSISDPIKETTGSPSTTTVAYNVSFSVKEADVTISIKTKELQEVKVNVVKNHRKAAGTGEPDAQKQVYDGNPKPILFTTTPAGLEKLVNVKYATPAPSSSQLGTTAPSLPGEYTATLTFEDKEGNYVYKEIAANELENVPLFIDKAKLSIETLPTVTLGNDGKYVIGKEGKVKFGSTEVKGEFKAIKANGDPKTQPEGDTEIGKTHTVTLQFTPTSDSDKALYEYPTGSVIVKGYADVDPVKVAIWSPLPTGVTLKLYNGDKLVDVSKDEFLPGTQLTAVITYPAGMRNVKPVVTSGNTGTEFTPEDEVTSELSTDGKTYTDSYPVKLGSGLKDGKIEFNVKADAVATYTVKFDKQTFKYDGQMHGFKADKIHVYGANNQEITSNVDDGLTVTYKDKNGTAVPLPRDAGSYTVCIRIEATEGYGLYEKDFADQLVIEAIPATVYAWPVASMISKGFPVSMSMLTGGAADVPGTFSWHPEDAVKKPQKIESKAGDTDNDKNRFRVVFTPESKNYSAVTTPFGTGEEDQRVEVEVSDLQIVTFGQEEITVKNKAGVVLQPGSPIIKGDELTITVEPKEGFELESLTVNGSANSGKYTVGDESVAIVATFKVKKADPTDVVLTFPTETSCLGKGYRLSVYGAKGLSFNTEYKFTVSTLAADKSKLVVTAGGQTVQANADGSYTVKADASKTITVSLSTPTKLKVSVERVTKNAKGNVMGKVEVEGLSTTDSTCYFGDEVTIVAFPESGVTFGGWSGDITSTDKLATFTVKEPMTIKPKFTGVPTGIETIEGMRIYGREGHIFIGCDGEAKVTLISMDGRVKKVEISGDSRIETAAGVYGVIVEKGSEVLKEKVIVK